MIPTDTLPLAGSILIENGTTLPHALVLQRSVLSSTWSSASDIEGMGLQEQLTKAGWTLFFMAGPLHRMAFGFDKAKRQHACISRIIQDVQKQSCNCVEITSLETKAFLGIPYVSITAHARHIQDGCQFRGQ